MADYNTPSLFDESLHRVSGIYLIQNIRNAKVYVGSTNNLRDRKAGHFRDLRAGRHCNSYLQYSFNRNGRRSFVFRILEECEVERLQEREQFWIDYYSACDPQKGYNIQPKADRSQMADCSRAKMSAAQSGRKHSAETKKKISQAHKGRPKSAETKEKLRCARTGGPGTRNGHKNSAETCKKISEAARARTHPRGWKHTEDAKRKMSEKLRAAWARGRNISPEMLALSKSKQSAAWTPERRAAQSAKLRGVRTNMKPPVFSESARKKISETHKGRVVSDETRQRMSEARRAFWERKRRNTDGVPPARVTRFQPLQGIARFYRFRRPFGLP